MIPKKIHYCWVGGSPLPESAKKCIKSWKKYCRGYEIIEWNENNYDFTSVPYMKEAYEAKKWGFVPDYARLDIIYTHGGIYLDTDVEIIKPLDPLLELKGFAGFQNDNDVALGLGFGAEKGNPVIKALADSYKELHFIDENGGMDLTPAPTLNTAALIKDFGVEKNGRFQEIEGLSLFPAEYFCPKSYINGMTEITKNTYSIHHFDASWLTDEQRKKMRREWDDYREWINRKTEKTKKRERKLRRRRIFGGAARKIFGDKGWEKLKSLFLRG